MAPSDAKGNSASGNGKADLDALISSTEEEVKRLREARRRWEEGPLARALEKSGERRDEFETLSGLPTDRLYTPEHVRDLDYERDLGFPGQYPFTRGIQPTMYRGRYWTIRQYAGFGTPEATNERFKFLLSQGQPGLSTAFDLPTQMGLDSDDSRAAGEVGQVGVAIDSLAAMETVFALFTQHAFDWTMRQNGYIFTYIGLLIVLMQGGVVGQLARRWGERRLLLAVPPKHERSES